MIYSPQTETVTVAPVSDLWVGCHVSCVHIGIPGYRHRPPPKPGHCDDMYIEVLSNITQYIIKVSDPRVQTFCTEKDSYMDAI